MQRRHFVLSTSSAQLFEARNKLTKEPCEPAPRHAQTDPPQLHRQPGFRLGPHGPVLYTHTVLSQRVPQRWICERGRAPQAHRGAWGVRGRGATRGRAPQARSGHLHSHVLATLSPGAAHRILH